MRIRNSIREAFRRDRQASRQDRARLVDEQRARTQADAWTRPGGPVDPGFVA